MRPLFNAWAIATLTFVWSIAALLALPFSSNLVLRIARIWSAQILWACGVKVEVRMPEVPLAAPAYLVMANHTSHFDVLALYATFPIHPMRPVAKKELGYIPLFGWALALGAAIMIDRKSKARAIASIDRAAKTIRSGKSVLMFPEGTRTPQGEIGPFKKGPFHLAMAAKVPVLPVVLHGTGDVLRASDWRIHPGRVIVRIGDPILPEGETEADRDALQTEVERAFAHFMREIRTL